MSHDENVPPFLRGAGFYYAVCGCALALMVLPLLAHRLGGWSLVLPMIGGVSLALNLRSGPRLFLICLAWFALSAAMRVTPWGLVDHLFRAVPRLIVGRRIWLRTPGWGKGLRSFSLFFDFILALSVLIYVMAHARLVGVTRNLFPIDRRLKLRKSRQEKEHPLDEPLEKKRPEKLVQPQEGLMMFFGGLLIVSLAQVLWIWMSNRSADRDLAWLTKWREFLNVSPQAWQLVAFLWTAAVALIVIFSVLGYLGSRRITKAEGVMLIQDHAWQQTRREQSRIQRWIAWGNKKRKQSR